MEPRRTARRTRVRTALGLAAVALGAYAFGVFSHQERWFPTPQIERAMRTNLWTLRERRGFKDTTGRIEVSCDSLRQPGTAVLLVLGQSNAANEGETPYEPGEGVYNFNLFDGKCYVARDPLLGTTGAGGSPWGRLGDQLIAAGVFQRVLIVPLAVGGSAVREWAVDGRHFARIVIAKEGLDRHGLQATHVLWHQGEADALHTSQIDYVRHFRSLLDGIQALGIDAPVYVAIASICRHAGSEEIRSAQREIIATMDRVRAGPDTDTLDRFRWRFDLCHFSAEGLDLHARLWFEILRSSAPSGVDPRLQP